MKIERNNMSVVIEFEGSKDQPLKDQLSVLLEALEIHADRHAKYGLNWRRKGWRGALFGARLALERAWDTLWAAPGNESFNGDVHDLDVDDLLDNINYSAMAVRQVREGNRDGEWRYPA